MNMVDSHGRFVWYELMTTDMEAAKAFYANVVGWGARDASMPGMAYSPVYRWRCPRRRADELAGGREENGREAALDRICRGRRRGRRRRTGSEQLGGAVYVPPTDIPDISRFSVVADPQMATLALVKGLRPGQEQSAELGAPGRVGWHELLAADWEKAFAFYSELFGWQKADADGGAIGTYQVFSAGGQTIGGMFTKPPTLPVPFWLYYFNVGDIDAAAKRVRPAAAKSSTARLKCRAAAGSSIARDPQGAIFALRGKTEPEAIGYFERVTPRDPSDPRSRRWSW